MKMAPPQPPVLVAGLARAGEAALQRLFSTYGSRGIFGWDASGSASIRVKAAAWRARGVDVKLGSDGTEFLSLLEPGGTIIKSPGIDVDIPLIVQAKEAGIPCIDELEYGWRLVPCPIVAITGTNGKSTTSALIASVLRAASLDCQIVGNTEFGPPLSGCTNRNDMLVCEVSSFQLEMSSTFLPDFAVFTNLTPEHLSRHRTMENYAAIKSCMFIRDGRAAGVNIFNIDDPLGAVLLASTIAVGGRALSYGFDPTADVRVVATASEVSDAHTRLMYLGTTYDLKTQLPGRHNALNMAAAFAFGAAARIDPKFVVAGIQRCAGPDGRWQVISSAESFDVIVDYAHTPDGLHQVLSTANSIVRQRGSRLHTVFGPVGLPDPPKAAGCAAALAQFSDHIVLTTGSAPRSARVIRIKELRDLVRACHDVETVLSRRAAIERGIRAACPGDIVLILGIGALRRLIIDAFGTTEPFNDKACAQSILTEMRR